MRAWAWTDAWCPCCGSLTPSSQTQSVPSFTMSRWKTGSFASSAMGRFSTPFGTFGVLLKDFVAINHQKASGCFNKNKKQWKRDRKKRRTRGNITNASSLSHMSSGNGTRLRHVLFPLNHFDLSLCSFSENVSWHLVYLVTLPHNFILTQKPKWIQKGQFFCCVARPIFILLE